MSMPVFPEDGLDITREQAFNMLLGSIAMEELGLSHIINAEGEKLQYVLGTLPRTESVKVSTKELLEVNQSITTLLEHVAHNQFLLKGKLAQVLDAQEKWAPPPCPPPCPCPCPHPCPGPWNESRMFRECRGGCWCAGQQLIWREVTHCGENTAVSDSSTIPFCPNGHALSFLCFCFELLPFEAGPVSIALSYLGACSTIPILKSGGYAVEANIPIYLSGSTVLLPPLEGMPISGIVCSLCEPPKVCVKTASLTLTTLATSHP